MLKLELAAVSSFFLVLLVAGDNNHISFFGADIGGENVVVLLFDAQNF